MLSPFQNRPVRTPLIALLAGLLVLWGASCGNRVSSEQPGGAASQKPKERPIVSHPEDASGQMAQAGAQDDPQPRGRSPFANRVPIPELFPKDAEWINSRPLRKKDLKGKYVLLDFWTYCCINCMHILPELKKLEQKYPKNLVVIGVHSAKFEAEKDSQNIREAVLRYEIEHPVVNDYDHTMWDQFGITSWPSIILIDPEGYAVRGWQGETKFDEISPAIQTSLPYYRSKGVLDESPVRFDLEVHTVQNTPLRFPGKVLADEAGKRLFISDSNHNRIVIATLGGKLIGTVGSGAAGRHDGDLENSTFYRPQGMALDGNVLYVADTENHLIRKIDLDRKRVNTVAGTGEQGNGWPGLGPQTTRANLPRRWIGKPLKTAISSPWALWIHKKQLYIAMAGTHQIWKMPLAGDEIGPYAGNGREDIVDGPLLPAVPYSEGYCSFAQPSGLASDGEWLFVADSEGSSIRAVPFDDSKEVHTLVGTAQERFNRLFTFGFEDGDPGKAQLQHVLGVTYHDGKVYAADTYNNAVREIDAESGKVSTLAGVRVVKAVRRPTPFGVREVRQSSGKAGDSDAEGTFDEPGGISYAAGKLYVADSNNHSIRIIDLGTRKVGTLEIAGLTPPDPPKRESRPTFPGAAQVRLSPAQVQPLSGGVRLNVELALPEGWKINEEAPMSYLIDASGEKGPVDRRKVGRLVRVKKPASRFQVVVPVSGTGSDTVKLAMTYYYCQEGGQGLCKAGSVIWTVPLTISTSAGAATVKLPHRIEG